MSKIRAFGSTGSWKQGRTGGSRGWGGGVEDQEEAQQKSGREMVKLPGPNMKSETRPYPQKGQRRFTDIGREGICRKDSSFELGDRPKINKTNFDFIDRDSSHPHSTEKICEKTESGVSRAGNRAGYKSSFWGPQSPTPMPALRAGHSLNRDEPTGT